ncbi:MAG: hypothetical protein ACM3TU_01305 [Bacillota bacterium]
MKIWQRYLIVLITFLVAAGGSYWYYQYNREHSSLSDVFQVRTTVSGFGDELRQVSLLAPAADVAKAMDSHYSYYVHPDLLAKWKADPIHAPGRLTSSPWPDFIEITSATKNPDGSYTVDGMIAERTSSDVHPSNFIRVRFIVTKGPDGWQITDYQKL